MSHSETPSHRMDASTRTKTQTSKPRPGLLPPWRVLLHNDDVNDVQHVTQTVVMLTRLNEQEAIQRTREAHNSGVSLLLTTHQERAELYVEQFASRGLTVSAEPAN